MIGFPSLLAATIPQPPPPSLSQAWPELVVAGALALLGLRSAWKVTRVRVELDTLGEHALYALYVTARVGIWFVLAALFVGYGIVDDRQSLSWLVLVFIGLAAVQLLTSFFLGRAGPSTATTDGNNATAEGNGRTMATRWVDPTPGPLEPEKHGETSEPGNPQPEAAEVESARVLANEAREALHQAGIPDEQIRRLADEFIALDRGEGLPEFIEWAKGRVGRS
jgi:hypothetical protein